MMIKHPIPTRNKIFRMGFSKMYFYELKTILNLAFLKAISNMPKNLIPLTSRYFLLVVKSRRDFANRRNMYYLQKTISHR